MTPSSTGSAQRDPKPEGVGFYYLDHLTHNVYRGHMDKWIGFYAKLFNFRQIRFFDIEGKLHRPVLARADQSPCGKIRIPINEEADDHSQIEEYLKSYSGEGIQHIAVRRARHLRAPSRRWRATACRSCRRRRRPTTRRSTRACPATASRSRA